MSGCEGCIHYSDCGYFGWNVTQYVSEEERISEDCFGCCCGDGYTCNKGSGCMNWEDGSEPILG